MKITPNSRSDSSDSPSRDGSGSDSVHQRAAARNHAARKTSRPLLDPHGIYGTRTASRLRAARRRQAVQNTAAVSVVVAIAAGAFAFSRERHVAQLKREWRSALMTAPTALPAWGVTGETNPQPITAGSKPANTPQGSTENGAEFLLVPAETGLVAMNAATGAIGARFLTDFPFRAQPLVIGSVAFAPSEDGTLFAIDWRRGRALWSYRSGVSQSTRPAYTRVTMPKAPPAENSAPSSSATDTPADVAPSPGASGPRPVVVAANDDGWVSAFEAGNGRLLWRRKLDAPVGNGLTASDGTDGIPRIYAPLLAGLGSSGGLVCLDGATGRILWRTEMDAAQLPAPALDAAASGAATGATPASAPRIFTVGDNGAVVCFDAATGRKVWKMTVGKAAAGESAIVLRGEPLFKVYSWGRRLFVGGNDGVLRALDATNGNELWSFQAGAAIRGRPRSLRLDGERGVFGMGSSTRDLILVGADTDTAFALDARDGTPLWKCRATGITFAAPQVQQNSVVLLTREGFVEKFSLPG
ncbi:MAG TPA: PQQ-binding-like beta-propeller repeat protein [Abditibacteriaceae bacterium]